MVKIKRPAHDKQWEKASIKSHYHRLNVPAYHLGGWYDNLLQPTIDNYQQMNKQTDKLQKLIIGPWTHGNFSSTAGERNFGLHASEHFLDGREDLTDLHLRWFDYWLKGKETDIKDEAPIKLFVMGINEWRDEYEWPLDRTKYVKYYFHSNGKANSRFGDGVLRTIKPNDEPADKYIYDPNNPVPTKGGQTLYYGINTNGPQDQRKIEEREDVLVYTSEPLTEPVEVTGQMKVILWAETDAIDTSFTAKLVDVQPDGTAYHLTDGIIRAKYSHKSSKDLSGEIVRYEFRGNK